MKNAILVLLAAFLLGCSGLFAQAKPASASKEKPPTQKEMEDMMKEAQKMIGEMSPEDKKMMDSMGIKMPSLKNVPKVSDAQLAEAWENETRIVPKKDAARIAAIPKAITDVRMGAYITSIQNKAAALLKPEVKSMGDKIYSYIKLNSKNRAEAGNMAAALWIAGKPELSVYVLGKVCIDDPANTDNINNYTSILNMMGAQHLAIPILNNLNAKYPKNSTLLNNLGQAWFGLGDIVKAEKYLDSVIAIYAYHPQANMTKAAIEESRGNIEKAREAVKRSTRHAYTKEKEEKLARLGQKMSDKDFRMPARSKADPMNLGGFRSPAFPFSVDACVQAENEWKEFYSQVNEKIGQLKQQRGQALETAMRGQQQRMDADMALIKTAIANPGTKGQLISVPMYADRAAKKFKTYTDLYEIKLKAFLKKAAASMTGEGASLKKAYDQEMEKLRKEDDEQTGEGKPNRDFCPKYKEASNNFLKSINPKLEQLYMESLQLQKEFLNESAYWSLYIQWPDMYEVIKLDFQVEWLSTLTKGLGVSGFASGYPFVSITQYVCKSEEKEPGKNKLQKFDDVACQYNDTMNLKIIKFTNNCSRMTSEFDLMFLSYVRKDDFERAEGDTYTGSTIKISAEAGKDLKAGPLKIEAKAGAGVELELDRDGVKDVILIGEVKVGAGTAVLDENEETGSQGTGIAGKDAVPTTIEVGVEGRISIISGKGSVKGTGLLEKVTITEW